MPDYQDPTGHSLSISTFPQRIISLVPSQTELLYDLQVGDRVIGITKFCIHPTEWFRCKTRVGGTKDPHLSIIRSLAPDLIIANKEENRKEDIEILQKEFPTYTTIVDTIEQGLEMIGTLGQLTGTVEKAGSIIHQIKSSLPIQTASKNTAAYLIWKDPYMTVGGDTYIHDMMRIAGLENIFASHTRYPETDINVINELAPDYLLLSSEPYPFKEKHRQELQEALPKTKVMIVDGEMFSWYGSRMLQAGDYLKKLR